MSQIKVELIDSMGSDLTVCSAARVSFDKQTDWEWIDDGKDITATDDPIWTVRNGLGHIRSLSERDQKLIKYLARHNHIAPFQHPQIIVRETVPIFVARQRFKSVVGFTYSEISRRYVDDEPEFYVPDAWRKRAENKKQGSSDEAFSGYVFHEFPNAGQTQYTKHCHGVDRGAEEVYGNFVECALEVYTAMIDAGIAPEQARMVLPQSMLTSYYCTGSLAAFARAYKLRSYPDAQQEIRTLAAQWDEIIRPLFPHSWSALVD